MNKITTGISILGVAALTMAVALTVVPKGTTKAASTVVVTPTNTQGWSTADTRPGGTVSFVADNTSPYPTGALQLTTDATTAAKAQYLHEENSPLASVTELSYWTKQVSGPAVADASYQVLVDLNGAATGGFTTLVYEPYQNGVVTPGVWQQWDVDAGQFWSSRTFTEGTCAVVAGAGGAPFYSLALLQSTCPDAVVVGYGVNIGTFNPSYVVETDGFNFNGTVYDFEQFLVATTKDQCKDGGYVNVTDAEGNAFKNQGQCVSYVVQNS
jgi:hypothetical protein